MEKRVTKKVLVFLNTANVVKVRCQQHIQGP